MCVIFVQTTNKSENSPVIFISFQTIMEQDMESDPKTCPPIVLQPYCSGAPMAGVQPPPGCPPDLQFLTTVDQLFIMQKVELVEAFTGFETRNKYRVFNSLGQQILYSKEDSAAAQLGPST